MVYKRKNNFWANLYLSRQLNDLKVYYHQIKTTNLESYVKLKVDEENYFYQLFVTYNVSLYGL